MATFVQRPNGRWRALVRKKGWPALTKVLRTKRQAEDWARATEDEILRGTLSPNRRAAQHLTLKEALHRYLAEVSVKKSPSSASSEAGYARRIIKHLGRYSMASLTPTLIAEYRDQCLKTLSDNSVRLDLALISHLYTTAIREWGLGLYYNPVSAVRKPSPGRGRTRRLKGDEERRILQACDSHSNPFLGMIVRLAIETGMRLGEITSLRLEQVNLASRVIHLTRTKNGSQRDVPLSQAATGVIKRAMSVPHRPGDTDLVFFGEPGYKTGTRGPYNFQPAWQKILKQLQIEDLRFHDLRHEAISRLVEGGLGDQQVAAISGHKTMQMLQRYTHLRSQDLVGALDNMKSNTRPTSTSQGG